MDSVKLKNFSQSQPKLPPKQSLNEASQNVESTLFSLQPEGQEGVGDVEVNTDNLSNQLRKIFLQERSANPSRAKTRSSQAEKADKIIEEVFLECTQLTLEISQTDSGSQDAKGAESPSETKVLEEKLLKLESYIKQLECSIKEVGNKVTPDISEMKEQFSEMENLKQILLLDNETKIQKKKALEEFKSNDNLYQFYRYIYIKLEECFLVIKAASSGIASLKPGSYDAAGSFLLDNADKIQTGMSLIANSVTDNGNALLQKLCGNLVQNVAGSFIKNREIIEKLSSVSNVIPMFGQSMGLLCMALGNKLKEIDVTRKQNKATSMSMLFTFSEGKKTAELVARQLTYIYKEQLLLMSSQKDDNVNNVNKIWFEKVSNFIDKKIYNEIPFSPVQKFAQYGVMRMVGNLYHPENINRLIELESKTKDSVQVLSSFFIQLMSEIKTLDEVPGIWSSIWKGTQKYVKRKVKEKIPNLANFIDTLDGKIPLNGLRWTPEEIFSKPGIRVEQQVAQTFQTTWYVNPGSRTDYKFFGWKLGTQEVVSRLYWVQIQESEIDNNISEAERVKANSLGAVLENQPAKAGGSWFGKLTEKLGGVFLTQAAKPVENKNKTNELITNIQDYLLSIKTSDSNPDTYLKKVSKGTYVECNYENNLVKYTPSLQLKQLYFRNDGILASVPFKGAHETTQKSAVLDLNPCFQNINFFANFNLNSKEFEIYSSNDVAESLFKRCCQDLKLNSADYICYTLDEKRVLFLHKSKTSFASAFEAKLNKNGVLFTKQVPK